MSIAPLNQSPVQDQYQANSHHRKDLHAAQGFGVSTVIGLAGGLLIGGLSGMYNAVNITQTVRSGAVGSLVGLAAIQAGTISGLVVKNVCSNSERSKTWAVVASGVGGALLFSGVGNYIYYAMYNELLPLIREGIMTAAGAASGAFISAIISHENSATMAGVFISAGLGAQVGTGLGYLLSEKLAVNVTTFSQTSSGIIGALATFGYLWGIRHDATQHNRENQNPVLT